MPLEGNHRVTFLEPTTPTRDALNQAVPGEPTRHAVWARRRDTRGRERELGGVDVIGGKWPAIFSVRNNGGLKRLTETWQIEDDRGELWDVESVLLSDRRTHYEVHAYRAEIR